MCRVNDVVSRSRARPRSPQSSRRSLLAAFDGVSVFVERGGTGGAAGHVVVRSGERGFVGISRGLLILMPTPAHVEGPMASAPARARSGPQSRWDRRGNCNRLPKSLTRCRRMLQSARAGLGIRPSASNLLVDSRRHCRLPDGVRHSGHVWWVTERIVKGSRSRGGDEGEKRG